MPSFKEEEEEEDASPKAPPPAEELPAAAPEAAPVEPVGDLLVGLMHRIPVFFSFFLECRMISSVGDLMLP
jgi:hypothetical protein